MTGEKTFKMTIWLCAGLFIVVCIVCVKMIVDVMNTPVLAVEASLQAQSSDIPTVPLVSDVVPADPAPVRSRAHGAFITDYSEIRKMEQAIEDQMDKMEEYAGKYPEAADTLSAERIEVIRRENVLVQ